MNNSLKSRAFAKRIPTAFIIASPFQLLCALEAIKEFEIEEYTFVFCLIPGWERNEQMFAMAKERNIQYDVVDYGLNVQRYYDLKARKFIISCSGNYERVFIGDNCYAYYFFLVPLYAKVGAVIAYLDDGSNTISVLNGIYKEERKPKSWRKRLSWYRNWSSVSESGKRESALKDLNRIGVIDSRSFFTIYSDVKSKSYNTYPNKFSHLLSNRTLGSRNRVVIIIGAIIDVQAKLCGIDQSLMEAIMWKKMSDLRNLYKEQEIIYIPHGRDTNQIIPHFCEILNIQYKRLNETIESYLIKADFIPIAITGIISTAHTSLKKIFPTAIFSYWRVRYSRVQWNNNVSCIFHKYYIKSGIQCEDVWISKEVVKRETLMDNIRNILSLIC